MLGAGALFGEMPLFDNGGRSATARSLTTVQAITLHFDDVRAVLEERPELLWTVVEILARRLRATGCRSRKRSWPGWSARRANA